MQLSLTSRLASRRLWLGVGAALLALWLAWLAAANLFIASDTARALVNRKPERFQMHWEGGHSWWPGHVTLHGVSLRGHARQTRWSIQARQARGRIALWPLLTRQVRLPWVEADGVLVATARVAQSLPPPPPRAGGWTLHFERISTGSLRAASLWGTEVAGQITADTGVVKQLRGGPLEVLPSTARLRGALVQRDGERLLDGVDATIGFALPRHLGSDYPGTDKLALMKAELQLQAHTPSLRSGFTDAGEHAFSLVAPDDAAADAAGGGALQADLRLDGGRLLPGSVLTVRAPLEADTLDGQRLRRQLDVALRADRDLHLKAHVPHEEADGAPPLRLDVDLRVPGTALPIADWRARLVDAEGGVRVHWQVPSIATVLALFTRADWLQLDGKATVDADLRLAGGRLAEGSAMRIDDVDARATVLGNHFSGRARGQAEVVAGEEGQLRSQVALHLERFSAAPAGTPARAYVTGRDLRIELASDARFEQMLPTLQARLRFANARVPDLRLFNPYLPNDSLRFLAGSGSLSGDLSVDGDGEVGRGTLDVRARAARVAVAGLDLAGDVSIDGRLRRGNLQRGHFALGGTRVALRNVAFTEPDGQRRDGWWATVDLDDGEVDWARPASAHGRLRAQMANVGFVLAMFADRASYPAWIGRVVDAGQARVDGRWRWHPNGLVLDRVHAANDRFAVDARMDIARGGKRGDLYLGWGKLGVGVELDQDRRKLHLRGARQWFDGRPHLLP